MARRRIRRLNLSTGDPAPTTVGESVEGAGWQITNSAFIAIGSAGVSYSLTNGIVSEAVHAALLGGCGALLLTTSLDMLGDYVERAREWRNLHITIIMPGAVKPTQTDATEPETETVAEPPPPTPIESAAVRDARHDMLRLLQRAIEINGANGRQIPSDEKLGKAWGPTRRARVVAYFGTDLEIVQTGPHRGTFVAGHYTLGDFLAEVKAKTLPPLLPAGVQ